MVEIRFNFPVEEDAHKLHDEMNKFFQGSNLFVENNVIINPIKTDLSDPNKPIWYYLVDIRKDNSDTKIEKFTSISGGLLSIMSGARQVWALA